MLKGALLAKNFEAQSLKVSVQLLDKQWRGKKPESYKRGTDSQNSIEQLCEAPSSWSTWITTSPNPQIKQTSGRAPKFGTRSVSNSQEEPGSQRAPSGVVQLVQQHKRFKRLHRKSQKHDTVFSAQSLHAQSKSQAVQWSLRAVSSMPSPSSIPFLIATCSEFFGSNRSVITHLKNQSSNGRMVRDIDLKEALGTNRFKWQWLGEFVIHCAEPLVREEPSALLQGLCRRLKNFLSINMTPTVQLDLSHKQKHVYWIKSWNWWKLDLKGLQLDAFKYASEFIRNQGHPTSCASMHQCDLRCDMTTQCSKLHRGTPAPNQRGKFWQCLSGRDSTLIYWYAE